MYHNGEGARGSLQVWVNLLRPGMFVVHQPFLMLTILSVKRHITRGKEVDSPYGYQFTFYLGVHSLQSFICLLYQSRGGDIFDGGVQGIRMNDYSLGAQAAEKGTRGRDEFWGELGFGGPRITRYGRV